MAQMSRLCILMLVFVVTACSVMPAAIRKEAVSDVPYPSLVRNASQYVGETVIVGGYVVEVRNEEKLSRIVAVQAPLGIGDEPKSKDLSEGRLIIEYPGFLDPEVYKQDRKITVAGKLLGSSTTQQGQEPYPYLRVAASDIHLWEEDVPRADPYYWPHPYMYPYPYPHYYPWGWRHPYFW